jgi:hypothetical protein
MAGSTVIRGRTPHNGRAKGRQDGGPLARGRPPPNEAASRQRAVCKQVIGAMKRPPCPQVIAARLARTRPTLHRLQPAPPPAVLLRPHEGAEEALRGAHRLGEPRAQLNNADDFRWPCATDVRRQQSLPGARCAQIIRSSAAWAQGTGVGAAAHSGSRAYAPLSFLRRVTGLLAWRAPTRVLPDTGEIPGVSVFKLLWDTRPVSFRTV